MPLLQSINAKRFRTFGEMALDFVKNQTSCFQFTSVVVDIFDRYDIHNSIQVCFHCILLKVGLFLTGKSLLVLVKILLDFSAITLPNIFVRTVLSKKGNLFTWPVYFLILKQLTC
jgi:hypothetical protein